MSISTTSGLSWGNWHKASSALRYIVNPPGAQVRVHQHLDIGQGEIDWELFFKTLGDMRFDGILPKPFTSNELRRVVEQVFAGKG